MRWNMHATSWFPPRWKNQIHADNASRIKCKIIAEKVPAAPDSRSGNRTHQKRRVDHSRYLPEHRRRNRIVFQWLKNLSHVRFGRMEKRYTQAANTRLLGAIERMTGSTQKSPPKMEPIIAGRTKLPWYTPVWKKR